MDTMRGLTQDERFALRLRYLADRLEERVQLVRDWQHRSMTAAEKDASQGVWFSCVLGVGHGCRTGVRQMPDPPGALADPQARRATL